MKPWTSRQLRPAHQGMRRLRHRHPQLTAVAGDWIPACAEMTGWGVLRLFSYQRQERS